jgi:hypothetical protein
MKIAIYLTLGLTFMFQLAFAQEPDNLKPRYGDVVKSKEYIDDDNLFIKEAVQMFGSRKVAAKKHAEYGWNYYYSGDLTTAMKRFNQAWLLDSTLSDVNRGFGLILGATGQYEQSIYFLKKYQAANPKSDKIYVDLAIVYFKYGFAQKDNGVSTWSLTLKKGKSYIKKSLSINSKNAIAYNQMAIAYYYEDKKDSARYYGTMANKLDSKLIPPSIKKALGIK